MPKTIVITGASDGIGAAGARQLHKDGHRVVVTGRSPAKTQAIADELGTECFVADFTRLDDVRKLAAALDGACPRIDVLVNNAGGIFGDRAKTVHGFDQTSQPTSLPPSPPPNPLMATPQKGASQLVGPAETTPAQTGSPAPTTRRTSQPGATTRRRPPPTSPAGCGTAPPTSSARRSAEPTPRLRAPGDGTPLTARRTGVITMNALAGKVAIVTGASKGIGAGIAKEFAAQGARVVVNYLAAKAAAAPLAEHITDN